MKNAPPQRVRVHTRGTRPSVKLAELYKVLSQFEAKAESLRAENQVRTLQRTVGTKGCSRAVAHLEVSSVIYSLHPSMLSLLSLYCSHLN